MVVGVLALQGAFDAHARCLAEVGADVVEVRTSGDLDGVDALVIPGGESSTISMLLESTSLFDAIIARIHDGMPTFGTCAGMILLATEILDGRPDQKALAALDISVRRNAFGRQVDSFEATIETTVGAFHGVFIRAPRIERVGPDVEVLGTYRDEPVLVRQGSVMACSFHPELAGDVSVHRYFVEQVAASAPSSSLRLKKG